MPTFFQFTQGTESRARFQPDASPLLGRFRAVPPRPGQPGSRAARTPNLLSSLRGGAHVGYGSVVGAGAAAAAAGGFYAGSDSDSDSDSGLEDEIARLEGVSRLGIWWRRRARRVVDLWVEPKQGPVKRVVDVWWSRYGVMVVFPALLVSLHPCGVDAGA